jgi:hypothetical protein
MSQENVEIVRSTPVWNPDVQTACVRDVVMPRRRAGTDSDHAPAPWRQGGASHGSRLSSRLECVREGFELPVGSKRCEERSTGCGDFQEGASSRPLS